ncbi:single-stranded DNA-binding protein [Anaeromyxobacter oryzisoli]|uniref:single-stranded DNA-binding protein n=1 Tax=Anaeromyxobacter oryzisoli TaxID=2925408 RepID=UPI001F59179D|nr:single-stranded DNA-binding protein [Anaeromyxobacter sp. SG63]
MVNKVILVGFVGNDVEVSYTPGGQAVVKLRLATSRGWTDRDSGQRKTETEWHDVEVWGKRAEACGEHLAKGSRVYVEGRIKTDFWKDKQSGDNRSRVKIVADQVTFLGRGARGESAEPGGANEEEAAPAPLADVAA